MKILSRIIEEILERHIPDQLKCDCGEELETCATWTRMVDEITIAIHDVRADLEEVIKQVE